MVDVDVPTATVTVGSEADLLVDRVTLDRPRLGGSAPTPVRCSPRRARTARRVRAASTATTVVLRAPARRVAPGQSVVLYDGDDVVGGGIAAG